MIEMLELLCKIPDHIGWVIVGVVGTLTAIMAVKVGKLIYTAIRDRLVDDEECEEQSSHFFLSRARTAHALGIWHNKQPRQLF